MPKTAPTFLPLALVDKFRNLSRRINGKSTRQIVDLLDRLGFWPADFLNDALSRMKLDYVRRFVASVKDDEGERFLFSIEKLDRQKKKHNLWKHLDTMSVPEIQHVIEKSVQRGNKGFSTARRLVGYLSEARGVQMKLPWLEAGNN